MSQSAQLMAESQVSTSVLRDNSDAPDSAAALVRSVNKSFSWVLMPQEAKEAHEHRLTGHKQNLTGHEQNGSVQKIDPAPVNVPRAQGASFHALQEWEGYVLSFDQTNFVARLVDLTATASHEEEEAIIPRAELSDIDDARICEGGIFRWVIGYERSSSGTKRRVSQIVFRDLPVTTPSNLREGEDWAQEMVQSLNS